MSALRKENYLNLTIVAGQLVLWIWFLNILNGNYSLATKAGVLLLFCFVQQGIFAMMHECLHRAAFKNNLLNWIFGVILSNVFGTLFTLYSAYHLGHHSRNRSKSELAEFIFPNESVVKKIAQYYFAILGGLWISTFVTSLIFPFLSLSFCQKISKVLKNNSYAQTFNSFNAKRWNVMRMELIFSVVFWCALIRVFHWNLLTLGISYAALAVSWSSLQWIYHIGSPIHPVEGAYNLRLNRLLSLSILNYNFHLSHHRNPKIGWAELRDAYPEEAKQPTMMQQYFRLFLPPRRVNDHDL